MTGLLKRQDRYLLIILSISFPLLVLAYLQNAVQAVPNQIEVWENMGIYGGLVNDAHIDPHTDRVYLVLNGYPGFYFSDDDGDNWNSVEPGFGSATRLAIDSDGALYANLNSLSRSTDGGENWTTIVDASQAKYASTVPGFDIDPHDTEHIVIGTGNSGDVGDVAAYVSFDDGATWITSTIDVPSTSNLIDIDIDVTDLSGNTVFAINTDWANSNTPSYLYMSNDGGLSFTKIFTAPTGQQLKAIEVSESGGVYVGGNGGLYRTFDKLTWQHVITTSEIYFIEFSTTLSTTIFVDGYVSHDDGENWTSLPIQEFFAQSASNPDLMFSFSGLGIKKSDDYGLTWEDTVHGIEGALITNAASDKSDNQIIYVTSQNGVGRSQDGGESWEFPISGLDFNAWALAVDPNAAGLVYLGNESGDFFRSTDFGSSWTQTTVDPDVRTAIWDIAVDPTNGNRLYVASASLGAGGIAYGGLYRSIDQGATWITTTLHDLPINTVKVAETISGTVTYAGSGNYWTNTNVGAEGIFKSVDHGQTWVHVGLTGKTVNALAIHPYNSNVIYAGTVREDFDPGEERPLYRSIDGGNSWENLSLVNCGNVEAIIIDPNDPNIVIVSSCNYLHKSFDEGETWTIYHEGNDYEQFQAIHTPLLPPSPVTDFTAQVYTDDIELSWIFPQDPDLAGVKINYLTNTFPTAHNIGQSLITTTGSSGSQSFFTHTNLISETTYYYAAFSFDNDGRFSNPAWVSATIPTNQSLQFITSEILSVNDSSDRKLVYLGTSMGLYRRFESNHRIYLPIVKKE